MRNKTLPTLIIVFLSHLLMMSLAPAVDLAPHEIPISHRETDCKPVSSTPTPQVDSTLEAATHNPLTRPETADDYATPKKSDWRRKTREFLNRRRQDLDAWLRHSKSFLARCFRWANSYLDPKKLEKANELKAQKASEGKPGKSGKSAKPSKPVKPAEPEPAEPEPAEPEPAKPAKRAEPAKPVGG